MPQKTNYIIVANHTSFFDPLCVMAAVPHKIHCIVAKFLYRVPFLAWFLNRAEAIPTGNSSDKAVSLLMQNRIVGLFPEAGCSRDGKLREFKRGVALLAAKTGRPIVPCAIIGAYEAFPRRAKFPRFFTPIKVKIGKPIFLLKEFDEIVDDIYMLEGTTRIKNTIQEMINAG